MARSDDDRKLLLLSPFLSFKSLFKFYFFSLYKCSVAVSSYEVGVKAFLLPFAALGKRKASNL
jgi:hypothetical protein